ncbi:MAG: cyclic nucleotide-binding domain-containing protein [Oligoflexia bacterium]|nr:cyclic nucleotide-binding domain-containing protein [Oligoflexia bacterium]
MKKVEIKKGDVIFEIGERNNYFFIIKDGFVDIFTSVKNIPSLVEVDMLKPGDFIGEVSFFDNKPSPVKIIAKTACTLLMYTREDMVKNEKDTKDIFDALLFSICKKYRAQLKL